MKIFNKVLSVFLALLFVLALFPVGVFASEPWFEVGAETNEGELPVVTLKLDVDALKALLQGKEGETSSLGDGIALDFASLATVFTPEELFEIIPREDLLGIFSIEDILDQLEIAELEQYVDVNELAKEISSEDMEALLTGVTIGEEENDKVRADEVSYVNDDKTQVGIEIHSGRNRVVRRMFDSLGYRVTKLDRVQFAGLTKKRLRRGDWRFLTEKEVNMLRMGAYE